MKKRMFSKALEDLYTWGQRIDYKTGSLGRVAETKDWASERYELKLSMGIFTSTPHSVTLLNLGN